MAWVFGPTGYVSAPTELGEHTWVLRPKSAPESIRDAGELAADVLLQSPAAARTAGVDWLLLASPQTRVNGIECPTGIRVLAHRDEIRLADGSLLFFSAESAARIEPYPAEDSPACPRCRKPIEASQACVRCPRCRVAMHEMPERGCFTYADGCPVCGGSTRLDGELAWTPEESA